MQVSTFQTCLWFCSALNIQVPSVSSQSQFMEEHIQPLNMAEPTAADWPPGGSSRIRQTQLSDDLCEPHVESSAFSLKQTFYTPYTHKTYFLTYL